MTGHPKLRSLVKAIESLGLGSAWLDGEMVSLGKEGIPDFNALQNAIDSSTERQIEYFVFDIPYFDGRDLRKVPLRERRALLRQLIEAKPHDRIHLSQSFAATPARMLEAARQTGLEGIVLKRPDSPYVSARTETWLKLKCAMRQEFVVCGFVLRAHSDERDRQPDARLLRPCRAAVRRQCGHRLGFEDRKGPFQRLAKLEVEQAHFDAQTLKSGRWARRARARFVGSKPALVVEVSFADWTPDGSVRHAVFRGLRSDTPAKSVRREKAAGSQGNESGRALSRRQS